MGPEKNGICTPERVRDATWTISGARSGALIFLVWDPRQQCCRGLNLVALRATGRCIGNFGDSKGSLMAFNWVTADH